MCNIAGYVGTKDAAPVIIEMMKKEEGYSGGYYTGLATVSAGKLHMEKLMGDTAYLLANTPAASLPGKTGIMHSRSRSGGGDKWAHPFLDGFHKEPELAYVANGYDGCCADRRAEKIELARKLLEEGCRMASRVTGVPGKYTDLPDGSSLHMSDLMCQAISRNVMEGLPVEKAMDKAFSEVPSEIVGLVIHKETPDRIYFGRYNFPMFAAFCPHGAYLSSTPLAFPEDVIKIVPIPSCTCGYLTAEELQMAPLSRPAFTVAEEDARIDAEAYIAIEKALKEGKKGFRELSHIVKPMFTGADCGPYIHETHKVLWSLKQQGRLEIATETVPGVREDLTAPRLVMNLNMETSVFT